MAVELYSLTSADIAGRMGYPSGFSTSTRPTAVQVTSTLTSVAGTVNTIIVGHGSSTAAVAADEDVVEVIKDLIIIGVIARVGPIALDQSVKDMAFNYQIEFRTVSKDFRGHPAAFLGALYSGTTMSQGVLTHDPETYDDNLEVETGYFSQQNPSNIF